MISLKGNVLDAIIYKPNELPPLHYLSGVPYFFLTLVHMKTGHFVWLNGMGFTGCMIYTVLSFVVVAIDAFSSPSLGKNIQTLRFNGFTDKSILQAMVFNSLSSNIMSWLTFQELCGTEAMEKVLEINSYSLKVFGGIFTNLVMTEIVFYFAHKYLHEGIPQIHKMHHCCFAPTHSSNFIFHPLDFAIELGGPASILFANHFFLWNKNNTILLVTYMTVLISYALDHSDVVKSYHFKHHTHLDDVYTVYIKYRNSKNTKYEASSKGNLLDFFVHEPNAKPPLHFLSGIPYLFLTVLHVTLGHFVWSNGMGFAGCVIYFFLTVAMILVDGLCSHSLGKNIRTLRYNGFNDVQTIKMMTVNALSNHIMTWLVFQELCGTEAIAKVLQSSSYNLYVVSAIAINLAITEILFYFAHKYLHEVIPEVHKMHHCCFAPSHSSNFIFDPLDFAIELGGPTSILFVLHYLIWDQNNTILLVTYMIVQLFYGLDHSDVLQPYHFKHHTRLDDVYTVYIKYRNSKNTKYEAVRALIKRPPKQA
ncbi:hypothetical protein THRCLA_02363 [Thraustotheca clavata]|uniref:Fatty acid hydroxylase domain-containing protein n=1 Tax=Thraustotheca clavata TaxID=74557 RepID=A0A1W0A5G9_9STRA|nr:hypothetical protein THRCLA_02363 [Thraustotheca clavata]